MTASIDLTGRVSLVTGATGGIGQVMATELARLGSTVVIVCRDSAAGNELRARIVVVNYLAGANLRTLLLDALRAGAPARVVNVVTAAMGTPATSSSVVALAEVTGRYFDRETERKSPPVSYGRGLQERLWAASIAISC